MPDNWSPDPDPPLGGDPILFRPATYDRHARAIEYIEQTDLGRAPRVGRGRTTRPAKGWWGYLASGHSISAASGLTLGSGTVQLCSRSGSTLTADGEDVTVYNSGGTITGPKTLELDWTDGDWAVCDCGAGQSNCATNCSPCPIPKTDLDIAWTQGSGGSSPPSGTGKMIYHSSGNPIDGGGWWRLYPDPPTADGQYAVTAYIICSSAVGGVIYIGAAILVSTSSTLACGSGPTPCWTDAFIFEPGTSQCLSLNSHTCNPFHLYYLAVASPTECASATEWLADITIDGPEFTETTCCQTFFVRGCNGLPLEGITVDVITTHGAIHVIASGVTGADGKVTLLWDGGCDVGVSIRNDRFQDFNQTYSLAAGSSTVIDLTPAEGYVCFFYCAYPTAMTLNFTHSLFGSGTVTYNSTDGYIGTLNYDYPGCPAIPCSAGTIPITIQALTLTRAFSVSWPINHIGFWACPGDGLDPGVAYECNTTLPLGWNRCTGTTMVCFVPGISAFTYTIPAVSYTPGFAPDPNASMFCITPIPASTLVITE